MTSVKNKTIFKGDNNDNGRWRDTESDVIGCRAVTWARPPPCWRRVTTSTAGGGEKMSNDIPMSKSGGLKNDCCWWCWWLCWSMSVAPEPEWWSTMSSEPLPLCSVSSSSADYITSQTAVIHKFIFYCWCSFYCFYLTDFDRFICFNLLYLFSPSAYLFFNRVELSWVEVKGTKVKADTALLGNPISELYRTSLAIWDHTVLPATRHKWMCPAKPQPCRLVLDLPTPEGWKAELT